MTSGPNAVGVMVAAMALVAASGARAQMMVSETYLAASDITRANPPPGQSAQMAMNLFDISAELPVLARISRDQSSIRLLMVGASARIHSFDLRLPAGEDEYFPEHLYAIDLSAAYVHSLSPRWYGVVFGSVGLHTDFEEVDGKHVIAEGGGFGVRRFGALHLGLGPVFTYAFGKPLLLPAPFVRYAGAGNLSFELKFPRVARASYRIAERFEVGLALRSLYNNYRLGNPQAIGPDGEPTVIVFSDLTATAEGAVLVVRPLWLSLALGSTLHRTFEVADDGGDQLFDRGMNNGLVLSAALQARL